METQALAVSCAQNTELDEPLRFGVSTPGGFLGAAELQAVADAVGRRAEMVMAFEDFFATPPIAELAVVKYCGADPIITWEPWCWTDDRSPAVVQSVLSGALDDYASRWADEIRYWASTVYVRFAHEFNGDWYPWTPTSARRPALTWRHGAACTTSSRIAGRVMSSGYGHRRPSGRAIFGTGIPATTTWMCWASTATTGGPVTGRPDGQPPTNSSVTRWTRCAPSQQTSRSSSLKSGAPNPVAVKQIGLRVSWNSSWRREM